MGPPRTTVELLRETAANHPAADAFVTATGGRLSYGEWDRAADGVAAGLSEHGVTAGDVVCLLMPSSSEYMVCYQAAMRLGAIQRMLAGRGFDEVAARRTAAQMIDLQVRRQAMVLSFERLFMVCGIAFLCVLPLVFLLRMPEDAVKPDVHMEM